MQRGGPATPDEEECAQRSSQRVASPLGPVPKGNGDAEQALRAFRLVRDPDAYPRRGLSMKVENDTAHDRFLVRLPEGEGELVYKQLAPHTLELVHTEVDPKLRGPGAAEAIAHAELAAQPADRP